MSALISDEYKDILDINPEVKEALNNGQPVVALESTIISHGMPYPQNLETAQDCESIIRSRGVVPATTAIIQGKIKVGLNKEELEFMATSKNIIKCSRRDYAHIVSHKLNGSTTVATSIITANLAGIPILATGGIGGVHRGAEKTFDISRDLEELATTNIAVVCAGCKSILDIGLTLEYLETSGVPVLGYKTNEMPAFYTVESGFKLDYNLNSAKEIAENIKTQWGLGLNGGILVTNPIPEEDSLDKNFIDKIITRAVAEAKNRQIRGKEITPFLLSKIASETDGESLQANISLVENNCKLAAEVAKNM